MNRILLSSAAIAALMTVGTPAFAASLNLTATIRDFNYNGTTQNGAVGNPDFQNVPPTVDDHGIVTSTLGADGKPVYAGDPVTGTSTTHGTTAFNQWYNNTPGVNLSTTITLVANETSPGSGIYQYNNTSYFPIDNQLLGNQSDGHNFAFTTEIHTQFTYKAGQNFSFSGDDDVFVYINGQKVIDLGGIHGSETASVDLDTLGLLAGSVYTLDIFNAERHTTGSDFSFTTSAELRNVATPLPAALPLFATGLGVLGFATRRRKQNSRAA